MSDLFTWQATGADATSASPPTRGRRRRPRASTTALTVAVLALTAAVVVLQLRTEHRMQSLDKDIGRATAAASAQVNAAAHVQAIDDKRLSALEGSVGALTTQINDAKRQLALQQRRLDDTISHLPADWQSIVRAALPSVVQVDCIPPKAQGYAEGTGFAVRMPGPAPTGYVSAVLTNQHVVAECRIGSTDQVTVSKDGQSWPAELASARIDDESAVDIALLYTTASLPALQPGPPPAQGGAVGALGNPAVGTDVFTAGIVSKLWADGWIQHTVALNHGNSGGPLLDGQGRVVGINTWGIEADPDGNPVHDEFFSEPISSACVFLTTGCPFRLTR